MVVGNGHSSSTMLYCVAEKTLQLLWQTAAGLSTDRESTIDKSHNQSHDCANTGKDYKYKDTYYMSEINPSGHCFAVEEREGASTLIHLLDKSTGVDIKTVPLKSINGKREVHTVMMSSMHNGKYVLMIEGGYVVVVMAEELDIANIFNMV